MNIEKDIKKYIITHLMQGKDSKTLGDDDSLFETGIIDSLGALKLVSFIEERFNVSVEDEELIPENFETVNTLKAYIGKKLESAQRV